MDDSQVNGRYDMILGRDVLSELQIYLCLSDYTIRVNGGACEGCTTTLNFFNKGYVIITTDHLNDERFWDE